jgi:2-iminobutanoate/2-iminopropanoate deaminase
MSHDTILTENAPQPRGPYAQAVSAGGFVFVSGQLPLDKEGCLIGAGDIRAQTCAVFSNIAAILDAAGSSLDKVVKTTVFLVSFDDFAGMNETYVTAFSAPFPARSTVGIAPLPNGMLVEIECIALA